MCLACNSEILSLGVASKTRRNHPKEICTSWCLQRCCERQLTCGVISHAQQMCRQPKCHPSVQWAVTQPAKGQRTFWDVLKRPWAPRTQSPRDRHRVYLWGSWCNQTEDKTQKLGPRGTGRDKRVLNRDPDGWTVCLKTMEMVPFILCTSKAERVLGGNSSETGRGGHNFQRNKVDSCFLSRGEVEIKGL